MLPLAEEVEWWIPEWVDMLDTWDTEAEHWRSEGSRLISEPVLCGSAVPAVPGPELLLGPPPLPAEVVGQLGPEVTPPSCLPLPLPSTCCPKPFLFTALENKDDKHY